MNRRRTALILVLGLQFSMASPRAQQQQQHSLADSDIAPLVGEWTLDAVKSGVSDPERRVITQGPGWMRVVMYRPGDDRPPTLIYRLDGSSNTTSFGAGTATTEMWREKGEIVTVAVITINERPVTVGEHLTVAPTGELVAAVTVRVEHGYQGVLPPLETQAPNVAQSVKYFRKN